VKQHLRPVRARAILPGHKQNLCPNYRVPVANLTTRSSDLFRARLDQIINLKHELAQLAGQVDWDFIDGEIAPLYSDKGRPGIPTRFAIGLLLLKQIYGLSDEAIGKGAPAR
jgi:hypothetical protein